MTVRPVRGSGVELPAAGVTVPTAGVPRGRPAVAGSPAGGFPGGAKASGPPGGGMRVLAQV
ncbi:hypothetical protein [Streptomyces cremeus]|uniref:hypothetical protein n=1 Tax=Streptomyces cremeus TaxID=66881 RepID=UPI0036D2C28D